MSNPFDKVNWVGPLYRVAWEWPDGKITSGYGAWTRNRKVTEDTIAIMNASIRHWLETKEPTQ
jgi:hypothetical protein